MIHRIDHRPQIPCIFHHGFHWMQFLFRLIQEIQIKCVIISDQNSILSAAGRHQEKYRKENHT